MKITKQQLKEIIKEELATVLKESHASARDQSAAIIKSLVGGGSQEEPYGATRQLAKVMRDLLAQDPDDWSPEDIKKLFTFGAQLVPAAGANIRGGHNLEEREEDNP